MTPLDPPDDLHGTIRTAFIKGMRARESGKAEFECPYKSWRHSYTQYWRKGWMYAHKLLKRTK